jgi:hypothetical protein
MSAREPVFSALESLFVAANIAPRVTRRMMMPNEAVKGDLPVLIVWEQNEATKVAGRGLPSMRTWEAWLVVYFKNDDPQRPGASIINPILDAIELALAPSPAIGTQTLGGLVSHCWIEGATAVSLGDVDAEGLGGAVVPVKILVP